MSAGRVRLKRSNRLFERSRTLIDSKEGIYSIELDIQDKFREFHNSFQMVWGS